MSSVSGYSFTTNVAVMLRSPTSRNDIGLSVAAVSPDQLMKW